MVADNQQKDRLVFYDIESLYNLFTLSAFYPDDNLVRVWFLDDTGFMDAMAYQSSGPFSGERAGYAPVRQAIYKENQNFRGNITFHDLRRPEANDLLFREFGLFMDRRGPYPDRYRIPSDVMLQKEKRPVTYYMGYNSNNYDISMLTLYGTDTMDDWTKGSGNPVLRPPTAEIMRQYNDDMFSPEFKKYMPGRLAVGKNLKTMKFTKPDYRNSVPWKVRKSLLSTGRHIDVAELNEKQKRVGLKRLCGMLGLQILESDTLKGAYITSINELLGLVAYNVSDIVNLAELFHNRPYFTSFELKKGMLETYPELVYDKKPDAYAPDIRPEKTRYDRLCADSTSAKLSTMALCPYGQLEDIPVVSFLYPDPEAAKENGIEPFNVLEYCREFFYELYPGPEHEKIRSEFDVIYNYYKNIEGHNFNESKSYAEKYAVNGYLEHPAENIKDFDGNVNTNLFYYGPDGKPTSCFVTFSTGGIHGQEVNTKLFDYHMWLHEEGQKELEYVKSLYPDPLDAMKAKKVTMPDGTERLTKKFMKTGAKMSAAEYRDVMVAKPEYFKATVSQTTGKTSWKLKKDYAYTTADICNHEDFSSYYPNLLIWLRAFWNKALGYDRYNEIYNQKEEYGIWMNDESRPEEERRNIKNKRNGTKLILNSATGAGDAGFESAIRMNNRIISMRCIG